MSEPREEWNLPVHRLGRRVLVHESRRQELERRLVQADKLSSIGMLAAGVAHEVNTPLAVISTYAQMLASPHWLFGTLLRYLLSGGLAAIRGHARRRAAVLGRHLFLGQHRR